MAMQATARTGIAETGVNPGGAEMLERLAGVSAARGPEGLAERLRRLGELTREDLTAITGLIADLPRQKGLVGRSAAHLLDLDGKRLRPLCVALAARTGSGFGAAAREFAVAVELVHSATLLHDDVVDVGDQRRGAPTARSIYGNAASIFAGDWLLVEALRRVRLAGIAGTLDRLLDVIEEMIFAESLQLEARGRLSTERATYFRVVEGKTAALFRWAMFAGGRAGGLCDEECAALEQYGLHLGVAFQAVDDLLDLTGSAAVLGKCLFGDLREGKMTYPLIVALERDPGLLAILEEVIALPEGEAPPERMVTRVLGSLARTGAVEDCRSLSRRRAAQAVECLMRLPQSAARTALETVAEATVSRDR